MKCGCNALGCGDHARDMHANMYMFVCFVVLLTLCNKEYNTCSGDIVKYAGPVKCMLFGFCVMLTGALYYCLGSTR